MKKLFYLAVFVSLSFSCSSNCIECHPKLKSLEYNKSNKYYKQHHFLITCTKCHPNHPSKGMDKCGADCFDCHSREKLINTSVPAHRRLNTCTKCHHKNNSLNKIIPINKYNDFLHFGN